MLDHVIASLVRAQKAAAAARRDGALKGHLMCYSAKVWQQIREYMRHHGIQPAWDQFELLFQRRRTNPSLRIARAFEDDFAEPANAQERRIKTLIDEYRSGLATKYEQELFKQKKRLADAQQSLKTKETKAERESERIATNKAQSLAERLADLKRTEPRSADSRIYPTANALVEQFEKRKVFSRGRGQQRDQVFAFKPYLDILHEGADDLTGVLAGEDYLVTSCATGVAAAL